ncbi:uncharacterized protein LOC124165136 [Ischnura elegans]|uniref:uncharacterized protein LOC124165136 n=1 Tax=Ischnura elegans TaxID=197161 RepID=UPI001ED8A16A|nr:uncharacterized protein LOC124165136 [Ischnura elegans]
MDLMYLPDAFTFHVIRSPAYDAREYLDAAWEEEEERLRRQRRNSGGSSKGKKGKSPPCTKSAPTEVTRSGGQHKKSSGGRDACPMCKERKRRTLATYIRTKSRQDSECTIEEEEEGEEECGATKGVVTCHQEEVLECPASREVCA